MTKIKLKTKNIAIAVIILIVLITGIVIGVKIKKDLDYKKTYEYKLLDIGYSKENTALLISKLSDAELDKVLELGLYDSIPKLIVEPYYMYKNLDRYLAYQAANNDASFREIVAIINTGADREWYSEVTAADLDKDNLVLVNKFYKVVDTYAPEDLADVSNWYAYGEKQKLREEAYDKFIAMYNAAKNDKQDIFMTSPYRTFAQQEKLYNDRKSWYGQEEADAYTARPGFSEHQTGLAVDVSTYGIKAEEFDTTEEFIWLQSNAYKFGYILRYPKDKEYLTGYSYEPWHYRYVGVEVAQYIYEHDITFDEYYAYFIEK